MVFHLRFRWLMWLAIAFASAGCAAAPAAAPNVRAPAPIPTLTASCRYARQVSAVLSDLDEIVQAGEGAGDITGATHVQLFAGKAKAKLGTAPQYAQLRQDTAAALLAADKLATAWVEGRHGDDERQAYENALKTARRRASDACGG